MWKSAYVGVYQLLNWKMYGETLKLHSVKFSPVWSCFPPPMLTCAPCHPVLHNKWNLNNTPETIPLLPILWKLLFSARKLTYKCHFSGISYTGEPLQASNQRPLTNYGSTSSSKWWKCAIFVTRRRKHPGGQTSVPVQNLAEQHAANT